MYGARNNYIKMVSSRQGIFIFLLVLYLIIAM